MRRFLNERECLTIDGTIVNIDGTGNEWPAWLGPRKIIYVIE